MVRSGTKALDEKSFKVHFSLLPHGGPERGCERTSVGFDRYGHFINVSE